MLNLAATETIRGVAGAATSITYTISGLELVGTTETYKILAQSTLPSSAGTLYTAPASTQTFVKEVLLANTTAGVVTATLYVNGTAAANQIASLPIPANGEATFDQTGWKVYDSNGSLQTSGVTTPSGTAVGTGRLINTTAPVTGGGDLSADRTIALTTSPTGQTPVGVTRTLNTTAPVTGGGDLSADRTLAISAATTAAAGSMSAVDKLKLDDTWIDVSSNTLASPVNPTNSAAANVTNFNALTAAAPSGSTLYFPGGSYQFNANMTIPAKAFTFQGNFSMGHTGGYTILEITGVAGFFTLTSGNWYTTFNNIVFRSGATQTSSAMVTVNNNVGVNFTACTFAPNGANYQNDCINYTGANSANTTVVDRCFFSGFKGSGIYVDAAGASLVVTNSIFSGQWGTSTQTATACIQALDSGALQVDNSDLIGATNNMLLAPTVGKVNASTYVTNTYMDASNGSCLKISGAGATVRARFISVSFTTSTATTGLSAVEISTSVTAGAQGIDFENCSILNTFGTTGTTNAFLITGAADFSIIACRIAGWTNGINVTPYNSNGKTQPMIEDNTIGPTGGYGLNTVGILLNAGAVQYGAIMIQNNQLQGNTTALTDASTTALATQKLIQGNGGLISSPKVITASSGAINTTETYPATALALPANGLLVGSCARLVLQGTCTSTVANVSTFTVRVGTTGTTPASDTTGTAALATSAAAASGTTIPFTTVITITAQAIGASTVLRCTMHTVNTGVTGILAVAAAGATAVTGAFNNNVALFLNASYKSAAVTTTSTFVSGGWEIIQQ